MGDRRTGDLSGQRYGRLTVVRFVESRQFGNQRHRVWLCRCDCGGTIEMITWRLRRDARRSGCGCHLHGETGTLLYGVWEAMNSRCYRPSDPAYHNYGGRGIAVAEEWRGPGGFVRFRDYVGARPSAEHTLDRIDNDGDYAPGNVRWATRTEQARNTRTNRHVMYEGRSWVLPALADHLGIHKRTLAARIERGRSDADAVLPVKARRAR